MPTAARADLETLLRARKLDGTLTTALPEPSHAPEQVVSPTGIRALDDLLGGGVPRGQLSEVIGPRSSGRTSVLMAMLAAATARGELVALVDAQDAFDPLSAAACGVDLRRLLWVRGEAGSLAPRAPIPSRALAIDRAIKALNLVLQAGGFGLVALDLAEMPAPDIRRLPFTTWLRLQRVLEGRATTCVMLGPSPIARSAGGVTIALRVARGGLWQQAVGSGQWVVGRASRGGRGFNPGDLRASTEACATTEAGASDPAPAGVVGSHARVFAGLDVEARVVRARAAAETSCRFRLSSG